MRNIAAGDICENGSCTHLATGIWVGDGGTLAISREYMQAKWCDCCMAKVQLEHARKSVAAIPNLEARAQIH